MPLVRRFSLAESILPRRLREWVWVTGGFAALCLALPTLAASDHASGDGSGTDNERLLPGIYPASPVLESGEWLREPYDPFFDVDWSVALRGTYTKATAGERFDVLLVPTVGLEHIGSRSAINAEASAEIARGPEGKVDIRGLRLGLDAGYALDSVTRLTAGGDLSLTQAIAGTPGVASNVAIAPQTITGAIEAGITRDFGRFNVGLTGAAERNIYGTTTRTDGTVVDNSDQNLWSLDAGLRVGYQATPIFEVFGVASIGRDIFDHPSSSLLVKTDATDMALEAGVTGRWNEILEATLSTGVALRRFDAASLGEVTAHLYDASITFTPDPTWRMTAGFATAVAPPGPNAGGTTRIDYTADAEIAYTVNSWLALRAQAAWNTARFIGSDNIESGYELGGGADYMVNAHTALTADYDYAQAYTTTEGNQQSHRVTVGITLSR